MRSTSGRCATHSSFSSCSVAVRCTLSGDWRPCSRLASAVWISAGMTDMAEGWVGVWLCGCVGAGLGYSVGGSPGAWWVVVRRQGTPRVDRRRWTVGAPVAGGTCGGEHVWRGRRGARQISRSVPCYVRLVGIRHAVLGRRQGGRVVSARVAVEICSCFGGVSRVGQNVAGRQHAPHVVIGQPEH